MARGSGRRLSEEGIKRLRPPRSGRLEMADALAPGLVLRVTERGVKTFSVIYKVPGEGGLSANGRALRGGQHRYTLGQWPAKSLAAARLEARDFMEKVLEGRDPAPDLRRASGARHTNSVEAVSRRMIEHAKKDIASWGKIEQTLEAHVWPKLGARPISDITRADMRELLDGLILEDKKGTAREVRKHLSRLFNFAVDRELVTASPVARWKIKELRREDSGRALTDAELRAVWSAALEMGYPFGDALRLLMLTGQRKSDIGLARRSEFADRALVIPRERYKSRREHLVPLADPAWAIVEALPSWTGNDYFAFSTSGGRKAVAGWSKAKARLDRLALAALREDTEDDKAVLAPFGIHDLRRTCETRLARLGHSQEVRDAVLGHAKAGLQRTYNKYDYLEEKRAALAAYAEHVTGVVA